MWQVYINFSLLICINFLFLFQLKRIDQPLKMIGVLCLIITLFHLWAAYHFVFTKKNNQFVFHILIPIQYTLLSLYYATQQGNKQIKNVILISIPLFVVTTSIISLFIQKINSYNSYSLLIQNFLVTIWSLFYFRSILRSDHFQQIEKKPDFYISAGIFFFSLSDFFIEGIMNYLIKRNNIFSLKLYYISVMLSFILYISFIIGFIVKYKIKKTSLHP